jgi:hypothetical protein
MKYHENIALTLMIFQLHSRSELSKEKGYNVSVPYPKLGLAKNTGNVEIGAAPLVQY